MTDAHCHPGCAADPALTRRFVCAAFRADWAALDVPAAADTVFYGLHPWAAEDGTLSEHIAALREKLTAFPRAGVGEIGLDRLRTKTTTPAQRALFTAQLETAAAFHRPVVLHGAKCWGEVVKTCLPYGGKIPSFLFHGFSRAVGLLPDIVRLNGFVSVGPAVLNDHAVNYRELVNALPEDRLLLETDAQAPSTDKPTPHLADILAAVATCRNVSTDALAACLEQNAKRFIDF